MYNDTLSCHEFLSTQYVHRFCSKNYHPFNANDHKKYVVDDEYTTSWEVGCLCMKEIQNLLIAIRIDTIHGSSNSRSGIQSQASSQHATQEQR